MSIYLVLIPPSSPAAGNMLDQLRAQVMQRSKVSCKLRRGNTGLRLGPPALPQQDQTLRTMQLSGAGWEAMIKQTIIPPMSSLWIIHATTGTGPGKTLPWGH